MKSRRKRMRKTEEESRDEEEEDCLQCRKMAKKKGDKEGEG